MIPAAATAATDDDAAVAVAVVKEPPPPKSLDWFRARSAAPLARSRTRSNSFSARWNARGIDFGVEPEAAKEEEVEAPVPPEASGP